MQVKGDIGGKWYIGGTQSTITFDFVYNKLIDKILVVADTEMRNITCEVTVGVGNIGHFP